MIAWFLGAGVTEVHLMTGTLTGALELPTVSSAKTVKWLSPLTRFTGVTHEVELSFGTSCVYDRPPSEEIQMLAPGALLPLKVTVRVGTVAGSVMTVGTVIV